MYSQINHRLNKLKLKINQRESLLKEYQLTVNKINSLDNKKENYSKLLSLNKKQEDIRSKLKENKKLTQTYEKLIDEKEMMIITSKNTSTPELNRLNIILNEEKIANISINESLTAGRELLNEVSLLINELGKAKDYGITALFGMGRANKHDKHLHLKKAKKIILNIKRLSSRYQKELENIEITGEFNFDINFFINFIDEYITSLITAWIVQFKIYYLLKESKLVEKKIQNQIDFLEEKEKNSDDEIGIIKLKRIEIIEKV